MTSMISFDGTHRLFGDPAYRQVSDRNASPANLVYGVKRLIKRSRKDRFVQSDQTTFPFTIWFSAPAHFNPMINVRANDFFLDDMHSMSFGKAMQLVDSELRRGNQQFSNVRRVVVSVPVSFNHRQRRATVEAAAIAGLVNIELINETAAVAVAHWYMNDPNTLIGRRALFVNLGGRCFDVSAIEFEQYRSRILGSAVESRNGGEDFTNRMV